MKFLQRSKVLREESILQTRWLEITEVVFQDDSGQQRRWEAVHRRLRNSAAIIVAQLQPSGKYVLVRQFRPPTGSYVLEFPAGLVDGKETAAEAGLRELKEETGYVGQVQQATEPMYSSPGMLGETCCYVFIDIDETLPQNQTPAPEREPGEFMDVLLVEPGELSTLLKREDLEGTTLDIKLFAFFREEFLSPPTQT